MDGTQSDRVGSYLVVRFQKLLLNSLCVHSCILMTNTKVLCIYVIQYEKVCYTTFVCIYFTDLLYIYILQCVTVSTILGHHVYIV